MEKTIIFDYDGVLVDSFPNLHKIYKRMCEVLEKTCPEDIEDFRKIYGHDYRECYQNLGIKEEEYEIAGRVYKEELKKYHPNLFEGIREVLKILEKSYKLILLSANYNKEVTDDAKFHNIDKYFHKILGKEPHHEYFSKEGAINDLVESGEIDREDTLFLGDREIDYEEAKKAGIPEKNIILVNYGWGFDPAKIGHEVRIVSSPEEIITSIKGTSKTSLTN